MEPTPKPTPKDSEILMAAKALLNAHPNAWCKWVGSQESPTGPAYCALGATQKAGAQLGGRSMNAEWNFLRPAAREVAQELGRPLYDAAGAPLRGDPESRVDFDHSPAYRSSGSCAYFNNTADSLDEVNQMFCRAIERAVDHELKEEGAGVAASNAPEPHD